MAKRPEDNDPLGQVRRYEPRQREFELAAGDERSLERITRHIEDFVGPIDSVSHDLVSDLVHIDVHFVKPGKGRNFTTLITTGMSARRMTVPAGKEDCRYAELLV